MDREENNQKKNQCSDEEEILKYFNNSQNENSVNFLTLFGSFDF